MTVTSPASGARAPRRRTMRRLLATGAALMLVLGWASPALADTVAPSPTPSAGQTALSGTIDLSVAPAGNGVVRTGSALNVGLDLRNGVASATSDSRVVLAIGTEPIGDRGSLSAWLASEADLPVADAAEAVIPSALPGDESSVSLTVGADDPALAGRGPGVYALRATATIGDQDVVGRSVMVVPDDAGAAPVGIVVPITAGPLEQGLLTSAELSLLTGPDGDLTAQLGSVEGTAAILAVDPAIPAAIRVLGSAAPVSATAWLDRLEALANSRFALQFGDADLATQVQAGLSQPLQPTSLQAYMDAADFAPTAGASPAPSPSPTPGEPDYPTLAELTDIGGSPRSAVYWPATSSAGADVVAALGGLGTAAAPALTLLPSTATSAGAAGGTVAASATAGEAGVVVYDEAVSQHLGAAAAADDDDARAADLAIATADLVLATRDAGGRPVLVTVDRGSDRDRSDLRAAITAATTTPGFTPVSLEQIAATPTEPVEVGAVEADVARTAHTTLLMGDEAQVAGFATILDDPALLTGPQRAEILQLLGVAWRGDAEASALAVTTHRGTTAQTLGSVGIISTNVILASYGSDGFRPYVRNDLGFPVTLTLVAQPDDASLVVTETTEVRAQAASNTRVNLPIEARIANATAVVSMQLYSPTGVAIGAVESATVEVHAQWESIGLVVLVTLMVLFVVVGLIRTVRRRRVRRAQEAAEAEPAHTDDPPTTTHPEDTP